MYAKYLALSAQEMIDTVIICVKFKVILSGCKNYPFGGEFGVKLTYMFLFRNKALLGFFCMFFSKELYFFLEVFCKFFCLLYHRICAFDAVNNIFFHYVFSLEFLTSWQTCLRTSLWTSGFLPTKLECGCSLTGSLVGGYGTLYVIVY